MAGKNAKALILSGATRLFSTQGYHQTGINQLIEESGVAKATFYRHFPSKTDLAQAYVHFISDQLARLIRAALTEQANLEDGLKYLFRVLQDIALESNYRGCGMLNITAEFSNAEDQVRQTILERKDQQRTLIRELLARHQKEQHTDALYLLIDGSIACAGACQDCWPLSSALKTALELTGDR